MIYVKYLYNGPYWMVDASDIRFGTDMCMHPLYMYVKYLAYMAYLFHACIL